MCADAFASNPRPEGPSNTAPKAGTDTWEKRGKPIVPIVPGAATEAVVDPARLVHLHKPFAPGKARYSSGIWRIDWATLLKRVHDLDALACPCGGRLKFVEVVTEAERARTLLGQLGLHSQAPPIARARSPTIDPDPTPEEW